MHTIELEALYASLLAEIDIFIKLGRNKEAEGVFAVMTRLITLYGVDGASLYHLFQKLEYIPGAYTYTQNIAQLADTQQLFLIATARECAQTVARAKQTSTQTLPPLFG